MSFRAQCMFCGYEVRVANHALGESACCPKCSNSFTLAPAPQNKAVFRGSQTPEKAPATIASSTAVTFAPRPAVDQPSPEPVPAPETCEPPPQPLVISFAAPRPKRRWLEPLGVLALLAGGTALLCASAPVLCRFVLPLGVLAFLLGAAGLVRVFALGRHRLLFPIAGTTVAGLLLATAMLFPSLLGPAFAVSRAKEPIDPVAIRVVPLAGKPGSAGTESPDWVDASRAALQEGTINVQVISASVRHVGPKSPSTSKVPPGDYHFIRLRTQHVDAAGPSLQHVLGAGRR